MPSQYLNSGMRGLPALIWDGSVLDAGMYRFEQFGSSLHSCYEN